MKVSFWIKRFLFLVLFSVLLCFTLPMLSACSQYGQIKDYFVSRFTAEKEMDKAVKVVEVFFNALMDSDYEKAYKYISSEDKKNNSLEDFKDEFNNVTQIVSIEINWVEVKNNVAIVGIDLTDFYDGEEKIYKDIKVSLVKEEDDSWRINFWN